MASTEALHADPIDKRHTLLNQLTPAVELKVLGAYSLTVPFNYITHFEFDVKGMQASIELFDPSFYIIDTFAFILAKMSGKGIPIKVRWGYAYNASMPTFVNERIQSAAQSFYLSKEYSLVVHNIESRPEERGSKVTIHFITQTYNPVLTAVPVKKTFVSGDLANLVNNQSQLTDLMNKWSAGNEADKKRATELKSIQEKVAGIKGADAESYTSAVRSIFGPNAEVVGGGGKLTFTQIFFELMKAASQAQHQMAATKEASWNIPLPMFPEEFDNTIDYISFNCAGDNIYNNLRKLGDMMISKNTKKGTQPTNFAQQGSDANKTKEPARFVMVGGEFTFHNSSIQGNALGGSLYKEAKSVVGADAVPPGAVDFCVWTFNEAPYETNVAQEPVATYKYHAGEPKGFDKNNLTEVLSYSAEYNTASQYFMATQSFGLSNVRNRNTGVSLDTGSNTAASAEDIQKESTQSLMAGTKGLITPDKGTDPSADKNKSNKGQSTISSPSDQGSTKQFEVPATINPDRDSETLKNFSDAIKSSVRDEMAVFGANMSILGDPKFDAVFMLYNRSINFEMNDKTGNTNPIHSGQYIIKNIKHVISAGKYTTELELHKLPSNAMNQKTENSSVNASVQSAGTGGKTNAGTSITNIQVEASLSNTNNKWTARNVYSAPDSPDQKKTDTIISKNSADPNTKQTLSEGLRVGVNKLLENITASTIEEVSRQVVGMQVLSIATNQDLGTGKDVEVKPTNFTLSSIVKS